MDPGSLIAPFIGPVSSATYAFPVAVSLIAVPFALYHYRRHGRVHPWRAFLSYSFVYYMIAALFLVILPLPERPVGPEETAAWHRIYDALTTPRLDPAGFLRDVVKATGAAERNRALAQIVFNVLLLVPFGMYVRYAFRRPLYLVPILGLGLSLVYEICQLTGNFGWYPGPYRLFDAGDLVLNTAGATAGGLLAMLGIRLGVLPRLDSLKGPGDPWIRPFRRLLATFLDGATVLVAAVGVIAPLDLLGSPSSLVKDAIASSIAALVFIVLPAVDHGRGLGKRLTFSAVRTPEGRRAPVVRILARQVTLWLPPAAAYLAVSIDHRLGGSVPAMALFGLWGVFWVLNALKTTFDNEHAGYVDRWLRLRVRDTWVEQHAPKRPRKHRRARTVSPPKGRAGPGAR